MSVLIEEGPREPRRIRPRIPASNGHYIMCPCGHTLRTHEETAGHWSAGHFDYCPDEILLDAQREVIGAAVVLRDHWREDFSHIPMLEQTRDFAPDLTELWNALSHYERVRDLNR